MLKVGSSTRFEVYINLHHKDTCCWDSCTNCVLFVVFPDMASLHSQKKEVGCCGVAGWSLQGGQQIKVHPVRLLQAGGRTDSCALASGLTGKTQQDDPIQRKLLVHAAGQCCGRSVCSRSLL